MKKQRLVLSLLLAGGLMLAVGAGCGQEEEDLPPPETTYEEPSPGIYEEEAPAREPEEDPMGSTEDNYMEPDDEDPMEEPADEEPASGYGY